MNVLRIRYRSKPDSPGFEYHCSKAEAPEQLAMHLAYCRYETVDVDGVSAKREIPTSDVIAEWVDDDKTESIPVPEYKKPKK